MIKEIPLLYSTPMVQAIIKRLKQITRRLIGLENINNNPNDWSFSHFEENAKGGINAVFKHKDNEVYESIRCPYGRPGDLIWVKETFCPWGDPNGGYAYKADGFVQRYGAWERDTPNKLHDVERIEKWKPSIFMPKEAARIWLQVTDIRVERLHDISEADAISEGVEQWPDGNYKAYGDHAGKFTYARDSFRSLWQKINGADSWQTNPFVWVISFKVLSTTGKPNLETLQTVK